MEKIYEKGHQKPVPYSFQNVVLTSKVAKAAMIRVNELLRSIVFSKVCLSFLAQSKAVLVCSVPESQNTDRIKKKSIFWMNCRLEKQ